MNLENSISVVVPVYLGAAQVEELVQRVSATISSMQLEFEIILVEDGSPDESWNAIEIACRKHSYVKGIKLSRNFGQHYAITAGLQAASGEWIVVMDCDLQDRPEEIPKLFESTSKGYDIIYARRKVRQDKWLKRISSKVFYSVFGYLTNSKQDPSIANFGVYNQKVIKAILAMKDHVRYFPTMVQWVGFSSTKVDVEHSKREEGKSSYSWKSLLNLAFNNIIAFSDKPLRLCVRVGFTISLISFMTGIFYLYQYFTNQIIVLGFTTMIISIWFLSGLIIIILGIIGIYLGKTFDRVKDRPTFIIDEKINSL